MPDIDSPIGPFDQHQLDRKSDQRPSTLFSTNSTRPVQPLEASLLLSHMPPLLLSIAGRLPLVPFRVWPLPFNPPHDSNSGLDSLDYWYHEYSRWKTSYCFAVHPVESAKAMGENTKWLHRSALLLSFFARVFLLHVRDT